MIGLGYIATYHALFPSSHFFKSFFTLFALSPQSAHQNLLNILNIYWALDCILTIERVSRSDKCGKISEEHCDSIWHQIMPFSDKIFFCYQSDNPVKCVIDNNDDRERKMMSSCTLSSPWTKVFQAIRIWIERKKCLLYGQEDIFWHYLREHRSSCSVTNFLFSLNSPIRLFLSEREKFSNLMMWWTWEAIQRSQSPPQWM